MNYSISDLGRFHLECGESFSSSGQSLKDCMSHLGTVHIDPIALTEFPSRYAFLGDRTILKDVKRTSWFSSTSVGQSDHSDALPPAHGAVKASASEIAVGLYQRLRDEIVSYTEGKGHVGLLLSGGMDSRMVAGILKSLQRETDNFRVTAFCWGDPETRDPIYAKQIADAYEWDFEHFEVSAVVFKRNVNLCAEQGCFYSPQHLHAMEDVSLRAATLKVECMLAGSYGDSIGRGEYSGRHVSQLTSVDKTLRNWFSLFDPDLYASCRKESIASIQAYHNRFNQISQTLTPELDYQLHYMRNQLGTCMSVIDQRVPLSQVFTSQEVVSYVWGFAPECRKNGTYLELLKLIDPWLLEIPWARTGKPYGRDNLQSDAIRKDFHRYSEWARFELKEDVCGRIFSGDLEKLGVFNFGNVTALVNQFYRNSTAVSGRFLEIIMWLSALSQFLRTMNESQPEQVGLDCLSPSRLSSLRGKCEIYLYNQRQKYLAHNAASMAKKS